MLIWIFPLLLGVLAACFAAASTRMRIGRAPDREGEQDTAAVLAYNQTGNWLPFKVVRYLVIRELKKLHPEGTLLDVGCGPGYLVIDIGKRFPGLAVSGLDTNPDMITAAMQNRSNLSSGNINFFLGDVHHLPYAENSIDLVVSTLSLHHWQNAGRALNEMLRVLKPGGRLLLMDLRRDCRRWFFYALVLIQKFAVPAAIRRTNGAVGSVYASYTVAELANMLSSTSFRNIGIYPASGWVFAEGKKIAEQV